MADLTYRDRTSNCSLTGGDCVEIPTVEGGVIYVYADAVKNLVASAKPPVKAEAKAAPPPAPEPDPEPEPEDDAEG
ncbi:MAG: hypothetical protein ACR2RF_32320 [Geminicoccaceae bacterium]